MSGRRQQGKGRAGGGTGPVGPAVCPGRAAPWCHSALCHSPRAPCPSPGACTGPSAPCDVHAGQSVPDLMGIKSGLFRAKAAGTKLPELAKAGCSWQRCGALGSLCSPPARAQCSCTGRRGQQPLGHCPTLRTTSLLIHTLKKSLKNIRDKKILKMQHLGLSSAGEYLS